MLYLTLKALHLILAVASFAGIFYLPRILVYLSQNPDGPVREQLCLMGSRLFRFTNILLIALLCVGILMLVVQPQFFKEGWMHSKLLLIVLLFGYFHMTAGHLRRFQRGAPVKSTLFYRIYNEVAVIFLLAIVLLAVFRPF